MIVGEGSTSRDPRRKGEERRGGLETMKGNSTRKRSRKESIMKLGGSHESVIPKVR